MSLQPGRVAAYADMLDCVAILDFPAELLTDFRLAGGSRLLTINFYTDGPRDTDLEFGPGKCSNWTALCPSSPTS